MNLWRTKNAIYIIFVTNSTTKIFAAYSTPWILPEKDKRAGRGFGGSGVGCAADQAVGPAQAPQLDILEGGLANQQEQQDQHQPANQIYHLTKTYIKNYKKITKYRYL